MKLTIMVTTMPSRARHLAHLVSRLGMTDALYSEETVAKGRMRSWTDEARGVEVLAYETPPFDEVDLALTFGAKRNALVDIARGMMVMCIDDDDDVIDGFLETMLPHVQEGVDVIGYKVACYGYANGCQSPEVMEPAAVSIKYNTWANNVGAFKYVRCPHHIVPTKREHVQAIRYKDMHHGEDHEYAMRMQASGLLKNEVYLDEFMYIYQFDAKKKKGE